MVQHQNIIYLKAMLGILNQTYSKGEHTMDEELLERRRSCLMSLSHTFNKLDKEVYEFCEVFSQSSEDLADAAEIFLKNLHGIYPESKINGRGVDSDNSAANS